MGKARHSSTRAKLRIPTIGHSKAEIVLINLLKKHNNQHWAHKFSSAHSSVCETIAIFKKWDATNRKEIKLKRNLFNLWSKKCLAEFRNINMPAEISSYGANVLLTKCRNYLDSLKYGPNRQ